MERVGQMLYEGISLNQYISNYKEIVLKLKGINEFEVLRGFIRGPYPHYEAYESQRSQRTWLKLSYLLRSMKILVVD